MQYVQKSVFSSDGISQDLVNLLGSYGDTQVKQSFEKAKKKEHLVGLMKQVIESKFINVVLKNPINQGNRVPFQSMEKAIKQLQYFTIDSPYYNDLETKQRKFEILLDSVTFVEAEALYKLVTGKYDSSAIKNYLFPPKKKKIDTIDEKVEPTVVQDIVETISE